MEEQPPDWAIRAVIAWKIFSLLACIAAVLFFAFTSIWGFIAATALTSWWVASWLYSRARAEALQPQPDPPVELTAGEEQAWAVFGSFCDRCEGDDLHYDSKGVVFCAECDEGLFSQGSLAPTPTPPVVSAVDANLQAVATALEKTLASMPNTTTD